MHTGRELSSQLPRDKTHSNSRSVTGGELRIPFPLVLSPGRAPGLRLDHRSPDLRSPPGGSSALTPSRTHGGHDGDPPGTRGMGAPRGQAPGWGPRSGAQSTWQAGLQTSSFTKVSQGERETNSGPRKKAGNTGTSGRGFHWSAWNLWAGQKTRGGGRLLRSSPPWEPAQQWQPGEGEGRGGARAPVLSLWGRAAGRHQGWGSLGPPGSPAGRPAAPTLRRAGPTSERSSSSYPGCRF